MTKTLKRIATDNTLPKSTTVVIIGAGIVGASAALTLAERNIPVVVLEKGHIGAEQSSRNLGWVRKTSRHADDVPLAQAADQLWAQMPKRVGHDLGYRQAGIMFLADSPEQMATHESWLNSVRDLELDSTLLTPSQIDELVPLGKGKWQGGIYTPSDGRAEPALATTLIAKAAMAKGAVFVQHCAVRTLQTAGGKISGVITELGEIACEQVLLTGGAWSRRFLHNLSVSLPTLPLICSVIRTKPMAELTEIAVGAPNFSFRRHPDGGFIITQRGALDAPLSLDHLLIGHRYLEQLKTQRSALRVKLNKHFIDDLRLARHWGKDSLSPFERVRTLDPTHNVALAQEAMSNLRKAWPLFAQAEVEEAWAGLLEVTPDSNPVIDQISAISGLTIATGFSGHGFGTGPAAGHLAADLVSNRQPIINPAPYHFARFN